MKNCIDCSSKSCKTSGFDCFSLREDSMAIYRQEEEDTLVKNSSALVDNGRAGTLSRFEETIEFCQKQGYSSIGLAYCFGLEETAKTVRDIMESRGLSVIPARCTMGGISEKTIDTAKTGEAISCNPAGQALYLNSRADFVIEFGLCLGHDVLFHQQLTVPFTVLLVKDRYTIMLPLTVSSNIHPEIFNLTIELYSQ